ncbi:MAG TPA: TIGR00730 family Rossman fold protein [Candidatus Limnocylindrales bacterium]|nr:TIGR00730 family Rossman fold protein [Candidatus Limnocylindrales bacterium]
MSANEEPDPLHLELIERLAAAHLGHTDPRARRLLNALIEDAIGLVADGNGVVDLKLVSAAFSEIRKALDVFRPWTSGPRKVTAFGSARTRPEEPVYQMAMDFGRRISQAGFMVITGGGPGIMGAVVDGAGVDRSFGVGIRLPFEQQPHASLIGDAKLIEFKYFFTRKLFFLKEASGVALFPGGFGTHDEGFETLTLVQTGKARMVPIVCVDVPGGTYWQQWDELVRGELLARGLISEDDLALYRITDDVESAVEEITGFYRVFHSMRTIRRITVLRLNHAIDDSVIETLSFEFADILGGRPIRRIPAMREESDEPEVASLPRLGLDFNLLRFGRLRMLINRLNELGGRGDAGMPASGGAKARTVEEEES